MSSKYVSDKLSFSSYSKVSAFHQIAIFWFFAQRNPYTAHNVGKTYTSKRKIGISEDIITDTVKRTSSTFNSFNFHQFSILMNGNVAYLQVFAVQRRFCQLQINSPVIAFLYIYKLKINAKLQEKTLARWDLSIHHVLTVSCVNLRSQNFVFNVFISGHGRFKATKK